MRKNCNCFFFYIYADLKVEKLHTYSVHKFLQSTREVLQYKLKNKQTIAHDNYSNTPRFVQLLMEWKYLDCIQDLHFTAC